MVENFRFLGCLKNIFEGIFYIKKELRNTSSSSYMALQPISGLGLLL
jgi:hypothetical protein